MRFTTPPPRTSFPPLAAAALALSLALLCASGCQVQKRWDYQPTSGGGARALPLVVGVASPFEDRRPSAGDADTRALGLIPFVLYGTRLSQRPEVGFEGHDPVVLESAGGSGGREQEIAAALRTVQDTDERARLQAELRDLQSGRFSGVVTVSGASLPQAAAASLWSELKASRMFEDVRMGGGAGGADLTLRGELIRTEERDSLVWYGFSIVAPLGWVVGIPSHAAHARSAWRVRLLDYKGNVLAEFEQHLAAPTHFSRYWGAHYYETLPPLWSDMNRDLLDSLREFLDSKPPSYWATYSREARLARGASGRAGR